MSDSISKQVFVNDGDTISVIAKTPGPLVSDPCDEYPYVSQAYRVVAERNFPALGPALVLVLLGSRPTRVSQSEVDQFEERKHVAENERWDKLLDEVKNLIENWNEKDYE